MPERSFGRMVRYRRTRLGLSQAKLGELVGRSTATIRSWERDKTRPNDEKVLSALAAILGLSERQLFEKAEVEPPEAETTPTVEQALATLATVDDGFSHAASEGHQPGHDLRPISVPQTPPPVPVMAVTGDQGADPGRDADPVFDSGGDAMASAAPAYVAPPEPYVQMPLTPAPADVSYIEDPSQRQVYRVRTLATLVGFVALVVALVWAVGEGIGALGAWWDEFLRNLRL